MSHCRKILVVEDDEDIRECLAEVLVAEGFEVHVAANGGEGLAKLRQFGEPALVLLDLMMPVMNGWEFLDAQKKDVRLKDHHVITMSAVEPSQSIEDPRPLATDGSLMKPLSLDSIWAMVNKHCSLPTAAIPT